MKKQKPTEQRSEEIQDLVERIPGNFGLWITGFLSILIIALVILGFSIKYPQTVVGDITINATSTPIRLVAGASGKLNLIRNAYSKVSMDSYVAIIKNPADAKQVRIVAKMLENFKIKSGVVPNIFGDLPQSPSMGELNPVYYDFLNAYSLLINYQRANVFNRQEEIYRKSLVEQSIQEDALVNKLTSSKKNITLMSKFVKRDSILYAKQVITEAEHDRTQMDYLRTLDAIQVATGDLSTVREHIDETKSKIQQNRIQKDEKENQLVLDLISRCTDLQDKIEDWEKKFVFKAPISGTLQYMKFLANNQFVEGGDQLFTIVPQQKGIIGQMRLPAAGSGKVKQGQTVIIKLENYPYFEYGSIKGKVSSIALVSSPQSSDRGTLENYLVNVSLPNGLVTNYGRRLNFKYEIKGKGEIITKDRWLIQRLFDNMIYTMSSK